MDITKALGELRAELQQVDDAILSLQRLIAARERKRGRPPAWMSQITAKRRGRPPRSKTKQPATG